MDGGEDPARISALTDVVKAHILSFLPVNEAVRTMFLSRAWRLTWTQLPGIQADLLLEDKPQSGCLAMRKTMTAILRRAMSYQSGLITKFNLGFAGDSHLLQEFLDDIFEKGALSDLSLRCSTFPASLIQLPSFQLLKHLSLHYIYITLPVGFTGFHHLITLQLVDVRISQEDIQTILDQSQKLTSLSTYISSIENDQLLVVKIHLPLLKQLSFCFGKHESQAKILNAPCLKGVSLALVPFGNTYISPEKYVLIGSSVSSFLEAISKVEHLFITSSILKCLSHSANALHTVQFNQLTHIHISGVFISMDLPTRRMFLRLFRYLHVLEMLELQCDGKSPLIDLDPTTEDEYEEGAEYPCLHQNLRRVVISLVSLSGLMGLMWIITFFLKNADVLEIIEIKYLNDEDNIKPKVLVEIDEAEKAFWETEIVFECLSEER